MSKDVGKTFDGIASSYDEEHRRAVPCFEELYGAVIEGIPADEKESFRVLDLGSGTGLLSATVGKAFPKAEITLADFSEGMMDVARSRFPDEPDGRFTFCLMDYVEEPLPGRCEVVVSALSLHHVGVEERQEVLRKVYEALEEGGVFINADQSHAGSHASAPDSGHHGDHGAQHDHPARTHEISLEEQLDGMRLAGFSGVERTYENGRFFVCSGRKGAA